MKIVIKYCTKWKDEFCNQLGMPRQCGSNHDRARHVERGRFHSKELPRPVWSQARLRQTLRKQLPEFAFFICLFNVQQRHNCCMKYTSNIEWEGWKEHKGINLFPLSCIIKNHFFVSNYEQKQLLFIIFKIYFYLFS
jgi:hypothetical protein